MKVPYYRCPSCDLTVYSAARHASGPVCPDCGSDLHAAARVFVNEAPPPGVHLQVARGPRAARTARRELENLLGRLAPDQVDAATLLTDELVSNSVKHAGPRAGRFFTLDVTLTDRLLRVSVTDGGRGFVPDARQRGLQLVDGLADRWGVTCNGRTEVWFELERHASLAALEEAAS